MGIYEETKKLTPFSGMDGFRSRCVVMNMKQTGQHDDGRLLQK